MTVGPRHRTERNEIETYVRNRLTRECKRHGTRSRVARIIGFNPSHISNVIQGNRGAGEEMARKLAEYWGISYAELERLALGIPPDPEDKLPNLRITIEWCREGYPAEFLRVYQRLAREAKEDRPRCDWLYDIDRQLRNWTRGVGIQPSGIGLPSQVECPPESMPPLAEPAPPKPLPGEGERSKARSAPEPARQTSLAGEAEHSTVRKKLREPLKETG